MQSAGKASLGQPGMLEVTDMNPLADLAPGSAQGLIQHLGMKVATRPFLAPEGSRTDTSTL